MAFKSYLNFKYSYPHETKIWNKLVDKLTKEFKDSEDEVYLVGNLLAEGKELDALLVKRDAIIVIDFKDYGGKLIISENDQWTISGNTINSNRKNPFAQLSDNKYAILSTLKKRLPDGYDSWVNIGHINALVLFHQNIDYDLDQLANDLSHSASRWFSVCDFEHFEIRIDEITSNQTSIRGERVNIIFDALGITAEKFNLQITSPIIEKEEKVSLLDTAIISEESFAEQYYRTAKELDSINFLIVGQDPYPTGANGVAFCKDNYYSLYVEEPEPAGAIVLKSMGIDLEKARIISRKNPKNLFYELLTKSRICFINVYSEIFDKIDIEDRDRIAHETLKFNLPIVRKAKTIILLGKGTTKTTFEKYYIDIPYSHVFIHPSMRAKEANPTEWSDTWETNKLEKLLID